MGSWAWWLYGFSSSKPKRENEGARDARIRFLVAKPSTPPPPPPPLAMASRDLRRLLDGAALVAREAARRSSGRDVLRSALLAATDLAGLTKGTPRSPQLPPRPRPDTDSSHPSSSVVYFTHDDAAASSPHPQDPPLEQRSPAQESPHSAHTQEITNTNTTAAVAAEREAVEAVRPGPSPSPAPVEKTRRRRERKVPSTPFTRALGSVYYTVHRFELNKCLLFACVYVHESNDE